MQQVDITNKLSCFVKNLMEAFPRNETVALAEKRNELLQPLYACPDLFFVIDPDTIDDQTNTENCKLYFSQRGKRAWETQRERLGDEAVTRRASERSKKGWEATKAKYTKEEISQRASERSKKAWETQRERLGDEAVTRLASERSKKGWETGRGSSRATRMKKKVEQINSNWNQLFAACQNSKRGLQIHRGTQMKGYWRQLFGGSSPAFTAADLLTSTALASSPTEDNGASAKSVPNDHPVLITTARAVEESTSTATVTSSASGCGSVSTKEVPPSACVRLPPNCTFPVRLSLMLHNAGRDGVDHFVSWQPDGSCFRVHDPEAFCLQVLGK